MKNPFSLNGKNHGTNSEEFHYYQINYNNYCVCLTAKEKSLLFFFALSHTHTHTHTHTNYPFQRQQHFTLSSSAIFLKAVTLYSFLLCYFLEGGNTLHSPSSYVPPKRNFFFSLLISCSIFPLPIVRNLGPKPKPKPSNSLYHCLFIRLFCYSLLN